MGAQYSGGAEARPGFCTNLAIQELLGRYNSQSSSIFIEVSK